MHSPVLKRKAYDNCLVRNILGEPIFYGSTRRAHWYLKRNLATIIKEDPLEIQLNFKTKGDGNKDDSYYMQHRENVCVVCGSDGNGENAGLNKHHVVPICYRRHFPASMKDHSFHDVLLLCQRDHEAYERHADAFKVKLGEEYNIPVHGIMCDGDKERWSANSRAKGFANAILKHSDRIPEDRKAYMFSYIKEIMGTDDLEVAATTVPAAIETESQGKLIVEKLDDIHAFCQRWREHFVAKMAPRYLPKFWTTTRRAR